MKVVIFNNIEDFEKLENTIHEALMVIDGYTDNTKEWAEPIYSVDKSKIALLVEADGIRGEIINRIIQDFEFTEILTTDKFWFEQLIITIE